MLTTITEFMINFWASLDIVNVVWSLLDLMAFLLEHTK